jgi:ribosomal protein L16 Arg81 hydroxylase
VLIVQCEGAKDWRISSLRADRPLEIEATEAVNAGALAAGSGAARERIALEFRAEPGDVVYIPRGQFHGATTPAGRSLHVTFGIRPLSGHDVALALGDLTLQDALFRTHLPPPAGDPDGARFDAYLAELEARVAALLGANALREAIAEARAAAVARSSEAPEATRYR